MHSFILKKLEGCRHLIKPQSCMLPKSGVNLPLESKVCHCYQYEDNLFCHLSLTHPSHKEWSMVTSRRFLFQAELLQYCISTSLPWTAYVQRCPWEKSAAKQHQLWIVIWWFLHKTSAGQGDYFETQSCSGETAYSFQVRVHDATHLSHGNKRKIASRGGKSMWILEECLQKRKNKPCCCFFPCHYFRTRL